ncbi:MAG: beta-ketoacyl-ACP synthase II [Aquiluna sp.]|jgi:3-oxoacyl-[acyl-carrier-protein] synthase II
MRRVVVTGIGATTPLGGDATSSWKALLEGKSGISTIEAEWVSKYELPVTFAGQAKVPSSEVLTPQEAKRLDPSSQLALISAREAWKDAGEPEVAPERLAVDFATGIGGVWTLLDAFEILKERGPRRVLPMTVPMLMPNGPAAAIGMDLGARAGVRTAVSACASGNESIANAFQRIRLGEADVVVAGGAEAAIHPLPIAAFAAMQALSKRNDSPQKASRPYDTDRDGFVMSEGAGALVLEEYESARARGAKIYCEIVGAAVTSDAYHITAPDPEGSGAARAVLGALSQAGALPTDVEHVNAHATSTPVGDIAEYTALKRVFGDHTQSLMVTATKSQTGHLLGGAGAIEAIFTILALKEQICPGTINLDNQDPAIELNVPRVPTPLTRRDAVAISNSFGFGGHNAVLAFRNI